MTGTTDRFDAVRAALDAEARAAEPPESGEIPLEAYSDDAEAAEGGKRESQASEIVKFILARCELAHDENSDVYAIDRQTREVRHIERRAFRNWIQAEFYGRTQKSIRAQSYSEAIQTIGGIGQHQGELIEVHVRCAAIEGGYMIDLGEPGSSRAIRIEPGAWRIVDDPSVMFIRPESLRPLPEPIHGSNIAELWSLTNIPHSARTLVLAWLMDSLRPDTPFPLLELIGEQGSAKSLTQTLLRQLIDPSTVELRSAPKNSEDVFVGAGLNWLLAYDNVSHLSADLQDTLCGIATGTTHAARRLYTNAEEVTIRAKRPISLNGIGASVTAQDLVDRTLSLELPVIEDRREAAEIRRAFEAAQGRVLGGLLDLFAAALSRLPAIEIARERRPRLIEYARLGCAVAEAMGRPAPEFLDIYETARAEAIGRTIDASPVAAALIEWLESRPDREGEHALKALYETLPHPVGAEAWPRTPKGFRDALRRAAPALRTLGIDARIWRRGGHTRVTLSRRISPGRLHGPHAPHADGAAEPPGPMQSMQSMQSSGRYSRDESAEVAI